MDAKQEAEEKHLRQNALFVPVLTRGRINQYLSRHSGRQVVLTDDQFESLQLCISTQWDMELVSRLERKAETNIVGRSDVLTEVYVAALWWHRNMLEDAECDEENEVLDPDDINRVPK
jgi:hypothetical protein